MRKNRRTGEGEGGRGGVEPFQDFNYEKVALFNMKRSKCLKMCYTSRAIIMSGRGERKKKSLAAYVRGGRFLSCTGGISLNLPR